MEQQKTETRSITAEQRKRVEEVCFRSLALIGRNCEYLEQHFDRTGADASTRHSIGIFTLFVNTLYSIFCFPFLIE